MIEDKIEAMEGGERKLRFLREKDLERHMKNAEEEEDVQKPTKEETEKEAMHKQDQDATADPPLNRAIELLKSWEVFKGKMVTTGNQTT